jgi:carbon starvation protein CstA
MTSEKQARSVFYGAMIAESIIALIWAAIGMAFWGGVEGLNNAIAEYGGSAAAMVNVITETTMGPVVAACVLVGVIGCAVTSGDTAFRCARLIVSDMFGIGQKQFLKRVAVSVPLFAVALFIIFGLPFQTIWSYFAWCNQTLAVITLWCITVYLFKMKNPVVIGLVPALLMTYVCSSYIFVSPMMCGMENRTLAYILGGVLTLVIAAAVHFKARKE